MVNILGAEIQTPNFDIGGLISNTWIYVGGVVLIGIILVVLLAFLLYYKTFSRKVVLFENISGAGYQPVAKTRARVIKLGIGGDEILKTQKGGMFLTSYGRKMGKNTYWFAKAQDGYFYNIILGDVDTKLNMLDIEPVDRDVRMFHVALDRLSHDTYGKKNFFEKYGVHILLFLFLIVLIGGMWFLIGKIGKSAEPFAQRNQIDKDIAETQLRITERLNNIINNLNIEEPTPQGEAGSGLAPA